MKAFLAGITTVAQGTGTAGTATEQYEAKLTTLKGALDVGAISANQYAAAVKAIETALANVEKQNLAENVLQLLAEVQSRTMERDASIAETEAAREALDTELEANREQAHEIERLNEFTGFGRGGGRRLLEAEVERLKAALSLAEQREAKRMERDAEISRLALLAARAVRP